MHRSLCALVALAFAPAAAWAAPDASNPLAPIGVSIAPPPGYSFDSMSAFGMHGGTYAVYMRQADSMKSGRWPIGLTSEHRDGRSLSDIAYEFSQQPDPGGIKTSRPQKICNGTQDGWLLQTDDDAREESHLVVAGADAQRAIAIRYDGKIGVAPDPAILASFESMCLIAAQAAPPVPSMPVDQPALDALLAPAGISLKLPATYGLVDGADTHGTNGGAVLFFTQQRLKADEPLNSVVLQVDPANGRTLGQYVRSPGMFDAAMLQQARPTKICNGTQDALLVWYDDKAHDAPMHVVNIAAIGSRSAASLVYMRDETAPDEPGALASFSTLCVK